MIRLIPVKYYHIDPKAKVICASHRTQSHKLLQHEYFPWCTVLQERPMLQFSTVSHESPVGLMSSQKTFSCMGSSPWSAALTRSLLLCGISTDCIFPHGTWTFSGSSTGCSMDTFRNGPSWAASTFFTMILSISTWTHLLHFTLHRSWCLLSCFSDIFFTPLSNGCCTELVDNVSSLTIKTYFYLFKEC